ncbi:MAG: hypothetical protein ABR524_14605, partial [Thermoanaerobaculia bacterium]
MNEPPPPPPPPRPEFLPAVAAGLTVVLAFVFLSDYVVLRLLAGRLLVPLVIAAATVFAAFGVGRVATRFVAGRFFPAAPL